MTFEVIDHEDEQYGCTTWVRCETCGGVEQVWDEREPEQARNEAESMHVCPPRCLLCDEPLPANDVAIGARIDLDCWRDQPAEAAMALGTFIEARNQVAS